MVSKQQQQQQLQKQQQQQLQQQLQKQQQQQLQQSNFLKLLAEAFRFQMTSAHHLYFQGR